MNAPAVQRALADAVLVIHFAFAFFIAMMFVRPAGLLARRS